jgi:small basic protein (TIGR04137 family)
MSIHSSLRSGGQGKKHRSVLKRFERLKVLKDKTIWTESKSVLGLPKVKQQRLKVKKEKVVKEAAAGPAAGAASPQGAADKTAAAAPKSEKK